MIDTYTVRRNLDGVATVTGMMILMVAAILLTFVIMTRIWNPSTDHAVMIGTMVVNYHRLKPVACERLSETKQLE